MKFMCLLASLLFTTLALAGDYYQLGSAWSKREVTENDLASGSPALKKAMLSLGRVSGGATAFYIGKVNGHHLGVSNHHVYPGGCRGEVLNFPFFKKTYTCTNLVATWIELDTTIFELDVPASDDKELEKAALKFAWHANIYPGQKLLTLGFGHHRNPQLKPVVDESEDCIVISGKNDFRRVLDPVQDPEPEYTVWSIADGCEASQGDSGSAVLDRATGEIVAVLWTTKEPKLERVQDTTFLRNLATTQGPEVWGELSYASPAPKLREFISAAINNPGSELSEEARATLRALIQ
jgi:hypothetical protein